MAVLALDVLACAAPIGETAETAQPFPLLTQPAPVLGCDMALARGRLGPNAISGLGLFTGDSQSEPVTWPFGYSARVTGDVIELLDEHGQVVARAGDLVEMGGGSGANGTFYACAGSVKRVTS